MNSTTRGADLEAEREIAKCLVIQLEPMWPGCLLFYANWNYQQWNEQKWKFTFANQHYMDWFFCALIVFKIQNHTVKGSPGSGIDPINVVVVVFDLVIVVVCFAVVANIVEFLFSSDSGGCSWEWSSLGTDCSKSGKTQTSQFKIQLLMDWSHDLKVLSN